MREWPDSAALGLGGESGHDSTNAALGRGGESGHDGGAERHHLQVLVSSLQEAVLCHRQLGRHLRLLGVREGGRGDQTLVQVHHQLRSRETWTAVKINSNH